MISFFLKFELVTALNVTGRIVLTHPLERAMAGSPGIARDTTHPSPAWIGGSGGRGFFLSTRGGAPIASCGRAGSAAAASLASCASNLNVLTVTAHRAHPFLSGTLLSFVCPHPRCAVMIVIEASVVVSILLTLSHCVMLVHNISELWMTKNPP